MSPKAAAGVHSASSSSLYVLVAAFSEVRSAFSKNRKGARLSRLLFTGGTVVTAEGSYRADVLVEDEMIAAVGAGLSADGANTVDASDKLVMPGFIDAHTHMDMPFGGTVTADDWATGTAAAVAGGTTTIIDFALQEEGGTLAGAIEAWSEKARDKALIDYGFHVAITDLSDDVKTELPSLPGKGIASVKIFMAYKGTPLYTEDDDLFEVLQLSRQAGVLVLVHAENGGEQPNSQAAFLETCRERGVLVGRGDIKNHATRLGPPLTVIHEAAEEAANVFEEALAEVGAGERAG